MTTKLSLLGAERVLPGQVLFDPAIQHEPIFEDDAAPLALPTDLLEHGQRPANHILG